MAQAELGDSTQQQRASKDFFQKKQEDGGGFWKQLVTLPSAISRTNWSLAYNRRSRESDSSFTWGALSTSHLQRLEKKKKKKRRSTG